jgi:membrane protease YdiL (CAAX protease family)
LTDLSRPDGPAEPGDPQDSEAPEPPESPETLEPAESRPAEPEAARPLGLTAFTMEGRRAPALFVVGWLATIIGTGLAGLRFFGMAELPGIVLWYGGLALAVIGLVLLGGSQAVERKAARAAYAGPSPMLVFLVVLGGSQLAGLAVGLPLSLIGASIPRPVGDLIAVIVQALVFFGAIRLLVVGSEALRWRDMGFRGDRGAVLRGLIAGGIYAGPVILITAVVAAVAAQAAGAVPESPLPPTGTSTGLVLHLLAGAVVAPVAEEVLFRGFALTAWRRDVGDRAAIARTSIVFVLAHLLTIGGDSFGSGAALAFVAGVARVPVALALGWIFVRTESIWAPIGLHATYNAILIVIAELATAG